MRYGVARLERGNSSAKHRLARGAWIEGVTEPVEPVELTALAALVRDIAEEAGALAVARRAEGVSVAATKSSPRDIVTAVDREVERLIHDRIVAARPDDAILGEEGASRPGTSGLSWVVDPIDGTVNFLYGIPAWSISIAVVEGEPDPQSWQALLGCVLNPVTGERFEAVAGGGATLGGEAIRSAPRVPLGEALLGTGFAYGGELRERETRAVGAIVDRIRDLRRIGSAALDLCFVGCGRLDGFFELGLNPWDLAAGALIAAEAGAELRGARGAKPDRALTIAAAPGLAAEIEGMLEELGYLG